MRQGAKKERPAPCWGRVSMGLWPVQRPSEHPLVRAMPGCSPLDSRGGVGKEVYDLGWGLLQDGRITSLQTGNDRGKALFHLPAGFGQITFRYGCRTF